MLSTTFLVTSILAVAQLASAQSQLYGQCGGINWTDSTVHCAQGTCTKLNDWYYQCFPGSNSSSSTSTTSTRTSSTSTRSSTSTSSSSSSTSTGLSGLPRLKGVNTAGYDFTVYTDGSFQGTGLSLPVSQFSHFANQGVNVFRVPWQLMTPTLGGTIDFSFFSRYDATVKAALGTGAYVILDLHNYARWNGQIINQGGPTITQYTSIWSQLAAKYASNNKIIFGIMNEPHDLPSIAPWVSAVQAVVNAIRSAGATSQIILIPGSSWSSAATLPTEAGPSLLGVTDPADSTKTKLVFDVHKYLDVDNSGTHDECITDNLSIFQTLVSWLKQNNRQAILSETGGGHTQSCYTYLKSQLAYIKSSYPTMLGFTVWSAGSFDTSYELSVTPNSDGSDQQLWIQAVQPNL
ncbi:putative cellulase precursor [Serendipita vermifera]|nr:putative cellulase precursor [Serendipita vermifera]